ncbi:hypothetical protein AC579_7416 [Pseudocercospora musae]|uniref:Uncharacterized protein n=1 Tax=Pseudocercospora musae TaxID=113226 RepID=A0A139IQH0_9PEZI|nr:hypothetical protein AC579_7416 [Pseudocercospora musae]KXT17014.1 hypothetical protein AC579_7416 [Pseudocercospora musae]
MSKMKHSSNSNSADSAQPTTKRTATFELSVKKGEHYVPVSTTKILGKFIRDSPPEIHAKELDERRSTLENHSATIESLRKWAKFRETNTVAKLLLRSVFWNGVKVRMPPELKIYQSIDEFFPPRSEVRVIVCDFGEARAERREVRLGDIEREFAQKPSWSSVRWIHAPLGVGLLHSSVEALFFHTGSTIMGRPFVRGGRAGWPYLEVEQLDLRKKSTMDDSRDLLRIIELQEKFSSTLDRGIWVGDNNDNLKKDVEWRAQYVGKPIEFWDLAKSDLPWQLSEGSHFSMNGPANGVRTTQLEGTHQSLSRHAFFQHAYLARNPFRTFHRNDGFLLTMSPAAGVDYLNANLPHYLEKSREDLLHDNFAKAIAEIYMEFSESGTNTWYRETVEWFLVYLITEIGTTPHNIRQGYSVPSLMDGYDAIVHELKERRYDRWQRNETISLVRAYLLCIDELTVLEAIFSKKLDFFRRLRQDVDSFEEQDHAENKPPDHKDGESPWDRIAFAEHAMEESATQCKRLHADLRESLNSASHTPCPCKYRSVLTSVPI